MADETRRDWKELAQLAATEQNPGRLLEIISELNSVLLERETRMERKSKTNKLLLVDDDKNIRLTLLPVLRERGFEAQIVATVAEAIYAIQNQSFDVLVSDLNISESGDGFTVVAAMRKAHPRSVIVLLTGYPGFESAVAGIHYEVDDYIVKPADYDVLVEILEKKLIAKRGLEKSWSHPGD